VRRDHIIYMIRDVLNGGHASLCSTSVRDAPLAFASSVTFTSRNGLDDTALRRASDDAVGHGCLFEGEIEPPVGDLLDAGKSAAEQRWCGH